VFYYINIAGIKFLWGISSALNATTSGLGANLNLPTDFFTSIQFVSGTATNMTSVGQQFVSVAATSTSAIAYNIYTTTGSGTGKISTLIIGN